MDDVPPCSPHSSSNANEIIYLLSLPLRTILAVLHFNENLNRRARKTKDGHIYYTVRFPKFKSGQEVVREEAVPATYGKS